MQAEENPTRAVARSEAVESLIQRNRAWVRRKTLHDPEFFERLAGQQQPEYFWIGCSDSRVPATEIVDLDPGEMFVHRNVANLVPADDPNFTAALSFAVDVHRVRHVFVVGHYGCGGIHAASNGMAHNPLGRWLAPLRSLYLQHQSTLMKIDDLARRDDRLCELNIVDQVGRLSHNPIVTQAWENGRALAIHGLVYSIRDGLIDTVCDAVSGLGEWPKYSTNVWRYEDDEPDSNVM